MNTIFYIIKVFPKIHKPWGKKELLKPKNSQHAQCDFPDSNVHMPHIPIFRYWYIILLICRRSSSKPASHASWHFIWFTSWYGQWATGRLHNTFWVYYPQPDWAPILFTSSESEEQTHDTCAPTRHKRWQRGSWGHCQHVRAFNGRTIDLLFPHEELCWSIHSLGGPLHGCGCVCTYRGVPDFVKCHTPSRGQDVQAVTRFYRHYCWHFALYTHVYS